MKWRRLREEGLCPCSIPALSSLGSGTTHCLRQTVLLRDNQGIGRSTHDGKLMTGSDCGDYWLNYSCPRSTIRCDGSLEISSRRGFLMVLTQQA